MATISNINWFRGNRYDILLFAVGLIHILISPYNKVEESFNTQATHDLIYHNVDIGSYDHIQYPGVVPRSFIGAIVLSGMTAVFHIIYTFISNGHKTPIFTRMAMLLLYTVSNHYFCRSFDTLTQYNTINSIRLSTIYTLLTITQFHVMFYCSRLLPNTYALILVQIGIGALIRKSSMLYNSATIQKSDRLDHIVLATLTSTCVIFRCDMVLFCIPLLLCSIFYRWITWRSVIRYGILYSMISIALTVMIDSMFWHNVTLGSTTYKYVWPEFNVLYFNTADNKSSQWGTSPIHWYITSALPRSLLLCILLVPIACINNVKLLRNYKIKNNIDVTTIELLLPACVFIGLYSLLPHKELRFILPVIPLLNMIASMAVCKIVHAAYRYYDKQDDITSSQSRPYIAIAWMIFIVILYIDSCAAVFFTFISSHNYPGGYAIDLLHKHIATHHHNRNTRPIIHIDTLGAMSGISRYSELSQLYEYDKSEGIPHSDYYVHQWDYLINEQPSCVTAPHMEHVIAMFSI